MGAVGFEPTARPRLTADTASTYDTSKTAGDHIRHQTDPENGTNEPILPLAVDGSIDPTADGTGAAPSPTADAVADLLRGLPADVVRAALEKLAGEVEK